MYVEVFKGENGDWYWHKKAENGQVTSEGGEGFSTRVNADVSARRENPEVSDIRFLEDEGESQTATR